MFWMAKLLWHLSEKMIEKGSFSYNMSQKYLSSVSKKNSWHQVKGEKFFTQSTNNLNLKKHAIYDLVLTDPIKLKNVEITSSDHPRCISKKCTCSITRVKARKQLKRIAFRHIRKMADQNKNISQFAGMFPDFDDEIEELAAQHKQTLRKGKR